MDSNDLTVLNLRSNDFIWGPKSGGALRPRNYKFITKWLE